MDYIITDNITNIIRIISTLSLIVLTLEYTYVVYLSLYRVKSGRNGYTKSILFWAVASAMYMFNDIFKVSLMGTGWEYRGELALVGSATVRIASFLAVTYLIYTMLLRRTSDKK